MKHKSTREFNDFFMQVQLVHAEIMANGVRVDKAHLDNAITQTEKQIENLEDELTRDREVYREWKRVYGDKLNLDSREQLAAVLYDRMGMASGNKTAGGGRASTQKKDLEKLDHPFVQLYLKLSPLKKALSTNLKGIRREIVERDGDWWIHPSFSLNRVVTGRPAGDMPNWLNFPKRNPEIANMVRPCFIPRRGCYFGEIDYSQIEVVIAGILTKDKELLRYIADKKSDMHRDQAMSCFMLPEKEIVKPIRQTTKGAFVFATFYGSPAYNTAKGLWDDMNRLKLKTASGILLRDHLASKGIKELGACEQGNEPKPGTFEAHISECNKKLWERFSGYRDWKRKQIDKYHEEMGMTMPTGYAITGPHSQTEIPNYKIQGSAFHCLAWSLVQISKGLKKHRMKSCLIGEIYDSFQFNAPTRELDDFIDMSVEIMTEKILKAWDWITVPLEVEVEVAERGQSWHKCTEWVRGADDLWAPKKK